MLLAWLSIYGKRLIILRKILMLFSASIGNYLIIRKLNRAFCPILASGCRCSMFPVSWGLSSTFTLFYGLSYAFGSISFKFFNLYYYLDGIASAFHSVGSAWIFFALSWAYKLGSVTQIWYTDSFLHKLGSIEFEVCLNSSLDLICWTSVISVSVNRNFVIRVVS